MNPAEWLLRTAQRVPQAPAILHGDQEVLDYAGFATRATAMGIALQTNYGITRGDRIAIYMPNQPQYLEVLYGAWYCGAAVVPINAKLHAREVAWILDDSGSKVVFTANNSGDLSALSTSQPATLVNVDSPVYSSLIQPQAGPAADSWAEPCRLTANEMLWLFYTSGTTGKPKGVMISAANIQTMTFNYFVDIDDVSTNDAALYAAPMSHGAGMYNFMHVLRGAKHVIPLSGGFDPAEIFELASKIGNISFFAAPTMIRRLVEQAKSVQQSWAGIKTIVYGGGPMYISDIIEAVDVLGPRFVQIYGQGESPMSITILGREEIAQRTHPRWRERLGSVGTAQSCVRVKIADAAGNELARGQVGEILVQGTTVMPGYWKNPDATAETLRDGWLWTGDMGVMDQDGYLTLRDRSKDIIISGGSNIYPREVEEVLLEHPSVNEVAVVGRAHPEWGEEVVAFVVPSVGVDLDPTALDAHCLDHIARFKRPREYLSIEALPKNNYGKVLKTTLRELIGE